MYEPIADLGARSDLHDVRVTHHRRLKLLESLFQARRVVGPS